jgi:TetR/AcrR family transcriptional regulator, ethionamide resistance regulator
VSEHRRRRRRPEEAERAILAAARAFLQEHPFREMKVEDVMARTGLSRPAFYAYFKDRYELVTRLLEGIGGLLFAVDRRWLAGDPARGVDESVAALREALRLGAETFERYGPVLRAISDAASYDSRVEEVYRFGLIERLTAAVADRIRRDVESGISSAELVPGETARALVLMTERYLIDAYGDPAGRSTRDNAAVVRTLQKIWLETLYGTADGSSMDPKGRQG